MSEIKRPEIDGIESIARFSMRYPDMPVNPADILDLIAYIRALEENLNKINQIFSPCMKSKYFNTNWKHKKGGEYFVLGEGLHSETEEALILYSGKDGQVWCRPLKMFLDGRFELIKK